MRLNSAGVTQVAAAAPSPCRKRRPISIDSDVASMQANDAAVNTARPPMNTGRRPTSAPTPENASIDAATASW
jgi:hypothetical protein